MNHIKIYYTENAKTMSKGNNVTRTRGVKNNSRFPSLLTPEYTRGVSGRITEKHNEGVDYNADVYINGKNSGITAFYDLDAPIDKEAIRFIVKDSSLDVMRQNDIIDEEATNANYERFRRYVRQQKVNAGIDEYGSPYFHTLKDALDYKKLRNTQNNN